VRGRGRRERKVVNEGREDRGKREGKREGGGKQREGEGEEGTEERKAEIGKERGKAFHNTSCHCPQEWHKDKVERVVPRCHD
jgi:hypothetical protein